MPLGATPPDVRLSANDNDGPTTLRHPQWPESLFSGAGTFPEWLIANRMAGFQHPIDARPADAERLGDGRGPEALRLHLAHPEQV
jgi:hypothetical protein